MDNARMDAEQPNPPAAASGSRAKRAKKGRADARAEASGVLWARCPECHMPVREEKLFMHLLNCPGAEVRKAEWAAQQNAEASKAAAAAAAPAVDAETAKAVDPSVSADP